MMHARPAKPRWRFAARHPRLAGLVTVTATLALLAPIVLPAALGVDTVARYWHGAPDSVPPPPLGEPSVILASDGVTELATLFLYNREVVTFNEISPLIVNGLVATEDARFYTHSGVDIEGIGRAVKQLATGGRQEGGSTITQQYVKMTLETTGLTLGDDNLAGAATEESIWRKLREAKLALGVEGELTKDDIVTGYLNLAYFGAGAYGVQAAAKRYFSTDATDVTLAQAATLVGLVNNPSRLDPTKNPDGAMQRRNLVLNRMATAGHITTAERDAAKAEPLTLTETQPRNGCASGTQPAFCDWVRTQLEEDPALGTTVEARRARLLQGGLRITSTLDLRLQDIAMRAVSDHVPADHRAVAAQAIVQPGTGNVLALASSRPYGTAEGQSVINFPTVVNFQPGSTFKTFTLIAALEARLPLDTRLPGGDRYTSPVFDNPPQGYFENAADGHGQNLTIPEATIGSVNTAYVQLEELTGTKAIANAALRAGLTSINPDSVGEKEGAFTLGTRETSPLLMASAYATIAAHGLYCEPRAVTSIVDKEGTELLTSGPRCTQAFAPSVADTAAAVLRGVVTPEGTGERAGVAGHDIAGKTGSTNGYGAAWFAGFTPSLASAVWIGDPLGPTNSLVDTLGESRVFGGTVPADIFSQTFTQALDGTPNEPLPEVNNIYLIASTPR